ncbi:MAG: DUF418 domain-containing protein, partial [Planctomycetota bacterium]
MNSIPQNDPSEKKSGQLRPVEQSQRFLSLDVIRGIAVLGILMMNILSFGLPGCKYSNPMSMGEISGTTWCVWFLGHIFFDIKFWSLFSLLFGAGISVMRDRTMAKGKSPLKLHYSRMFWLALIGLMHGHLLWFGDILFIYAITGMLLYFCLRFRPTWRIFIGLVLLMIGVGINLLLGMSLPQWDETSRNEMMENWQPSSEVVQGELDVYRGSYFEHLPSRSQTALAFELFLFPLVFFWRTGGLLLIGSALYQYGVITGDRSAKFYRWGAALCLIPGFLACLVGVYLNHYYRWEFEYSFFQGSTPNYVGGVGVSLGYICLINLWIKSQYYSGFKKRLAAVGQMALTNYLSQSVICTLIFYGHGLGWFGYLTRLELVGVVLAIWCFQSAISPIWLQHFRFGPVEWIWRSLTYLKRQP